MSTSPPPERYHVILPPITHKPCYTDPVANLTLAIDEDLLRRARIRAIEEGTSVNAVVRDFLAAYAGRDEQVEAVTRFLQIARQSLAGRDGAGRTWTREEIYEDRFDA